MTLRTERLVLRPLEQSEAGLLLEYRLRNREFLRQWEPLRDDSYYTLENMERLIAADRELRERRSALGLFLITREGGRIIGRVELSGIIYGPFLSCFLGYSLDRDEVNRGFMTEALRAVLDTAFRDYGLHRVEANVMPRNAASIRVLGKLGFVPEGMSPKYLLINGRWEDHIHYVLRNTALERGRDHEGGHATGSTVHETIRAADPDDLGTLVEMAHDLWPGENPAELETDFAALLGSRTGGVFLSLEDGRPAGFIQMSVRTDYVEGSVSSPTGYVEGVYVKPEWRRRGLSRRLLEAGETWLRSNGCTQVGSDIAPDNAASYGFHIATGFRESARLIHFIKNL